MTLENMNLSEFRAKRYKEWGCQFCKNKDNASWQIICNAYLCPEDNLKEPKCINSDKKSESQRKL